MSAAKRIVPAACAALLSLLAACSQSPEKAAQKPIEKVNGTAITKAQVDAAVTQLVAKQAGGKKLSPEQMQKASAAALEQLTAAELLYQEASKFEIKDLDKMVEAKFAQNRAQFPNEEAFKKKLASFHMTVDDVKTAMRKEIVVNYFIAKEFLPKAVVTDAEVRKFYDDNQEKLFKKGEMVKASHILVACQPTATPEEKKKAREKAEALLKRVQGGEDFAAVAAKESNCPSASRGGQLGEFPKGTMTPPFEKAVFAMKPGELSPVVETEFGYHVIKLDKKLAPATSKFEDVKDKIAEFLKRDKVSKELASYVAALKAKAKIEKS